MGGLGERTDLVKADPGAYRVQFMGAQRELWKRILVSLFLSGLSLFLLSWYLENEARADAEASRPLTEKALPALRFTNPIPGLTSGLPLRDLSYAETLELVTLPAGAEVQGRACLLDLRDGTLHIRRPAQVPTRIYLRGPRLALWSPTQRAQLLVALEELLESWDRDPSGIRFPVGEDFRTLRLWLYRDPIPIARR